MSVHWSNRVPLGTEKLKTRATRKRPGFRDLLIFPGGYHAPAFLRVKFCARICGKKRAGPTRYCCCGGTDLFRCANTDPRIQACRLMRAVLRRLALCLSLSMVKCFLPVFPSGLSLNGRNQRSMATSPRPFVNQRKVLPAIWEHGYGIPCPRGGGAVVVGQLPDVEAYMLSAEEMQVLCERTRHVAR